MTWLVALVLVLAACSQANEPTSTQTEAVVREPTATLGIVAERTATPAGSEAVSTTPTFEPDAVKTDTAPTLSFRLDAWADNWFAAYLGEALIAEDSVTITTERSFNAESATFEASYPLQLNFILMDYKANDTGLEYIGQPNQQMGDGGFIMQLTDLSTGAVVAVSNADCVCTVIHEAPLDKACENETNPEPGVGPCTFIALGEPDGWKAADYDDSSWTATTVHSAGAVSPKGGYDQISWDARAEFIWGPDLETSNTVLCRLTVESP